MSMNNETRRFARLPLYVAMLAALSLAGPAFAQDETAQARCEAETPDGACEDEASTGGYRVGGVLATVAPSADIGINAGDFNGTGNGVTVAIAGATAHANANGDVAIGNGANANSGADDSGTYAIVLGAGASAVGANTTAIGTNASVTAAGAVAIGANAVADTANTVSVGSASLQRQIVNVAAGTQSTDVVNVSQLSSVVGNLGGSIDAAGSVSLPTYTVQGVGQPTVQGAVTALDTAVSATNTSITDLRTRIDNGTVGLVQQASPGANLTVAALKDGAAVDFTGTVGTRKLLGVANGAINESSTEAVNGSQLYATEQNVGKNTGDITTINTQLDQLKSGETGLVQQNATTGAITVAAAAGGNVVDFTGIAGARVISGVAEGVVTETSNEAVNGSQLYKTEQAVSALDGRVSTAEGDITNIKSTLTEIGAGIASGIAYDDPATKSQVTLGGAGGTLVTNVKGGAIASGSMDAINGGQLAEIQDTLQNKIGGLNNRMDDIADGLGKVGNFDGDMENGRIVNLAPGVADTDAANLGQVKQATGQAVETAKAYTDTRFNALNDELQGFKSQVDDRFNRQDARIDRIGAMSAANTQMAINAAGVTGGKGRVAVGVGLQSDKSALSVGYANAISERVRFSFGGAFSASEASVGVGAGFDL